MDSEAYNMTAPKTDGAGMAQTMAAALENAGLQPEQLDYMADAILESVDEMQRGV